MATKVNVPVSPSRIISLSVSIGSSLLLRMGKEEPCGQQAENIEPCCMVMDLNHDNAVRLLAASKLRDLGKEHVNKPFRIRHN